MTNNHIAALFGNGVTVSYNNELVLSNIARLLEERFKEASADGEDGAEAVAALSQRRDPTGDPSEDFEALVGPIDEIALDIAQLLHIARTLRSTDIEQPKDLLLSLLHTARFLKSVRRFGAGHALEIIQEGTVADHDRRAGIDQFIGDLVEAGFGDGYLSVASLNYDGIILSSLLTDHLAVTCDMADGRHYVWKRILGPEGPALRVRPLRQSPSDFLSHRARPVRLLNLHGSITWWQESDTRQVYAIDLKDVRRHRLIERWRRGEMKRWAPAVVLTNQQSKSRSIQRAPFALAYEMFSEDALTADRWLIAGYSFRDGCVNRMLQKVLDDRGTLPRIFVCVYGGDVTDSQVMGSLGLHGDPESFGVTINREGLPDVLESEAWGKFLLMDD